MTATQWPAFELPAGREADRLPEERGLARDEIRLLVSRPDLDEDRVFGDLLHVLRRGDLLVVNESATLPARLPARGAPGDFFVHLSTQYGPDLWLAEPRWGPGAPGPIPMETGEEVEIAGLPARWVAPYPGIPRLGFVQFEGDVTAAMAREGRPIRYAYLPRDYPLSDYQTVFGRVPGSAEMPSAGRPFTHRLVRALRERGIRFASVLLHTGVSSLELDAAPGAVPPVYPEPFVVSASTVQAVDRARSRCRRVVAVGTTVARALESAADGGVLRPARGFTRVYLSPERPIRTFDGLLTGFHTATSTHLALLASFAGEPLLERAYRSALDRGYLWHEFGDSHLFLRDALPTGAQ
jgi:S-adenosylmethionine:tRNA ribosyltransferase-isomerase